MPTRIGSPSLHHRRSAAVNWTGGFGSGSARAIVLTLPPAEPRTAAILGLCADLAVAREENATCSRALRKAGLLLDGAPHPLLMVRRRATLRATTLTSRLKLLPSNDQREAQRWAKFPSRFGAAPDMQPRRNGEEVRNDDGSVNWVETVRKMGMQRPRR